MHLNQDVAHAQLDVQNGSELIKVLYSVLVQYVIVLQEPT